MSIGIVLLVVAAVMGTFIAVVPAKYRGEWVIVTLVVSVVLLVAGLVIRVVEKAGMLPWWVS